MKPKTLQELVNNLALYYHESKDKQMDYMAKIKVELPGLDLENGFKINKVIAVGSIGTIVTAKDLY